MLSIQLVVFSTVELSVKSLVFKSIQQIIILNSFIDKIFSIKLYIGSIPFKVFASR
jgi:hypothetical protein